MLSAECPTGVTITPDKEPFKAGYFLTCTLGTEGDDRSHVTYMWTGTVNGEEIVPETGSPYYTLLEGEFDLTCTPYINSKLSCASDSVKGTAVIGTCGNYQMQLNILVSL